MKMRRWLAVVLAIGSILILIGVGFGLYLMSKEPMEDFSFQVLDAIDSTPITGVEITVIERAYDYGYNSNPFLNDYQPYWETERRTFLTDEDGWGNISLKKIDESDGHYLFKFEKDGYISFSGHSLFHEGFATDSWHSKNDEPCNVRFFSSASLSGVVRDHSGEQVEGVTISVRYRTYEVDNFDITGPDGGYLLEDVRAGPTNLTIAGPGILTKHLSVDLEKFTENTHDIVVNRSYGEHHNVTLKPEITHSGSEIEVPDGDLVMLFMKYNNDRDLEFCWGAVAIENGEFNISVNGGRYDLIWFYLGDEDYNKIEVPRYKEELEENELLIISDRTIEIEIRLDQYHIDCC